MGSSEAAAQVLILPLLLSNFSHEPCPFHLPCIPEGQGRAWDRVGSPCREGGGRDKRWGETSPQALTLSTPPHAPQENQPNMTPPFEVPSRTGEFWALPELGGGGLDFALYLLKYW